jgi:lipoprotein NlpD
MPLARFPRDIRAVASRLLPAAALILLLASCASRQPAPVEDRTPRPPPPVVMAPPVETPGAVAQPPVPTYTVKRGDTLRQIAAERGLDYRELAAWNNIENINVLRVGQVLRLSSPNEPASSVAGVQTAPLRTDSPVGVSQAPAAPLAAVTPPPAAPPVPAAPAPGARNTETYKTQPKAIKEPYSEQALRDVQRGAALASAAPMTPTPQGGAAAAPQATPPTPQVAPIPAPAAEPPVVARVEPKPLPPAPAGDEKVDWVWPAKGKIVTGFSDAASLKGIDIAGASGQPVAASAGGKVVYAGTGLRGYGKLIIIKHNGTYLSAYAHNKEILVKEGQQVAKGQKIAEMGNTDADQVKLHFEIRRQGKPVDPLRYLPPA